MVELGTVLSFIQAAGIIVGVAYYIMNIQNNRKNQELALNNQELQLETRQSQLFMQVYTQSLSKEFIKQWYAVKDFEYQGQEDFKERYSIDNNPEFYYSFVSIGNYIDGLGVLVKRGIMDITLVNDMMGSYAAWWWRIVEPYIMDTRINSNAPDFLVAAEYLINEMIKAKKEGGTFYEWKSDQGKH